MSQYSDIRIYFIETFYQYLILDFSYTYIYSPCLTIRDIVFCGRSCYNASAVLNIHVAHKQTNRFYGVFTNPSILWCENRPVPKLAKA